jgi:beta-glucosidase
MTLEEKVLQMQNAAPALDRLGVPAYEWWNEALHGVARAGQATVFPQTIGLAATWDTELMRRVADVISTEARAKHHEAVRANDRGRYRGLTFWSPNINIFRDPRWGRGQETYGEDPHLTGRLAVAFVQGLQGTDPRYFKVIATPKHYAVHSGPESTRHTFDAAVSDHDLLDTYLPAFRDAIVEGKAYSIMCAYNRLDGVPACASSDLLEKRLRGAWGFQGFVVSDCGAISDIFRTHKYKATAAEASAIAVKAGTDLTCGNEYRSLTEAVKQGLIAEAEIDRSLTRLFEARVRLGMFDPPARVPFSQIPYSLVDSPEHRRLALEAARKSIVLLKNDSRVLPLKASVRTIAVIGPAADDEEALLGNYNGVSSKHVAPLEGLRRQFGGKVQIRHATGATYTSQSLTPLPLDALTPPGRAGNGMLAEYFTGAAMEGSPTLQRVEPRPSRRSVPVGGRRTAYGQKTYAVRWTGTLRSPFTGEYLIGPNVAGPARAAVRIFLDDKELVAAPPALGRVQLEAGRAYRFRVELAPLRGRMGGDHGSIQVMWVPPAQPLLDEAVAAATSADVTLAFVGLSPSLEGEEMPVAIPGFSGGDRTSIDLPEPQARLVEALVNTGKPVVVVVTSGSAVALGVAAQRAAAVLEAWYGGEEIGTAIAETLAGANNPAGRLPVTFYAGVDQLPPFDEYAMKGRTYRYFEGDALYGFGFGLSYSTFEYSSLRARRCLSYGRCDGSP